MDIVFHPTPCLFHEAEELLFLYANRFPMPEPLHPISPYYIPAPELARMTEEACRDIPLEDPTLRYFFQAYSLPHEGIEPYTCLGQNSGLLLCRASFSLRQSGGRLHAADAGVPGSGGLYI